MDMQNPNVQFYTANVLKGYFFSIDKSFTLIKLIKLRHGLKKDSKSAATLFDKNQYYIEELSKFIATPRNNGLFYAYKIDVD